MVNDLFQSVILGVLQGLGEFLPISSTAHLILAPHFFHWQDPGLAFDVALHLGTLIAVVVYFWRDWIEIISNINLPAGRQISKTGEIKSKYNQNLFWLIVAATIPGVLAGYFFENQAETIFRSPLLIAVTLSLIGLVLYLADKYSGKGRNIKDITLKNSLIIGLAQAVAIIPGVSRSGATIIAGLMSGLDRKSAARFSFLLSTPIIFGATVYQFPELIKGGINTNIITAVFFSALSGYFSIKFLIKFVEKSSYRIFFWYRLALSLLIASLLLFR